MIRKGTEGGGILLDVGRDKFFHFLKGLFKSAVFKISADKLIEIPVVPGEVFAVLHQIVVQRAVQHDFSLCRGIDGVIDEKLRVPDGVCHAQGVGAEGQVVVPGQDA